MYYADQLKSQFCTSPARIFFVHHQVGDRQLPVVDADSKIRWDARLSEHGKELSWVALLAVTEPPNRRHFLASRAAY
jgi:hypothetical protein